MSDVIWCEQCFEDVEIDAVSGVPNCPACNPEGFYSDDPFEDEDGVIQEIDLNDAIGIWP